MVTAKNIINNRTFVDEENITLIQDEDYDNYGILNTSRVDETSFIAPDTTEAASTLRLREKVKQDMLAALYRHLKVTGNIDLINLNQFKARIFEFNNYDRWVTLTKQTGGFFTPNYLRDRFGGVNTMKIFLGVDNTPPAL